MAKRVRHVIWDWNGTLIDDLEVVIAVMNGLLERRALPELTAESYRAVFEFPVERYYAAIGLDLAAEPFALLAAEWVEGFSGRWRDARLREGADTALSILACAGMRHSVLSAAEQGLLVEQADHFGVSSRFHRLAGIADHHAVSKVARGHELLAELALDPSEVVLVGDTTHDAEVAEALGVRVLLVADGHQSTARLRETGAPVVRDLAAVAAELA